MSEADGGGEERFRDHLAKTFPDDYIAIIGNDFAEAPSDAKNQIDVLLIGPPGVFIIEVKNWSGVWYGNASEWFRFGSLEKRHSPIDSTESKWERMMQWFRTRTNPVLREVPTNYWIDYAVVLTHPTCDTSNIVDTAKGKYLFPIDSWTPELLERVHRSRDRKRIYGYLEARAIADQIYPTRDADILAIDFGTSYCSVATYLPGNQCLVFHDKFNNIIIPSVFGFQGKREYIGKQANTALQNGTLMYRNYVASIKTYVGMSEQQFDEFRSSNKPQNCRFTKDGLVIRLDGKPFLAVDIVTKILGHLKNIATERATYPWTQVVISVPARSSQRYRALIREAARRAGFAMVYLIDEPTAAAIAYGMFHDYEGCVAVCDMGGGTFDFSVVQIERGHCVELVKLGELIGGDDFDRRLFEDFRSEMVKAGVLQLNYELKDRQTFRLMDAARRTKEILSGDEEDTLLLEAWHDARDVQKTYHRSVFDVLIADRVRACVDVCRRALGEIPGVTVKDVILVGGSTLVPAVRDRLREFFGISPKSDIDPNVAIVQGVAIRAGMYMGRVENAYVMTRVSEVTIGTLSGQIICYLEKPGGALIIADVVSDCYDERLIAGFSALQAIPENESVDVGSIRHVLTQVGLPFDVQEEPAATVFYAQYNIVEPLIRRSDRIEEKGEIVTFKKEFFTTEDRQRSIPFALYEVPGKFGNWAKDSDATLLFQKTIELTRLVEAGQNGIRVALKFDRDGRVEVEYTEILAAQNRDVLVVNMIMPGAFATVQP